MKTIFYLLLLGIGLTQLPAQDDARFLSKSGRLSLSSDAPLELIQAESDQLKGAIDISHFTFAFSVNMSSFEGFNSPLQQEHFNERYLETSLFPHATFKGKFIDKIDFNKNGVYDVRVKGILKIHNVEQEQIIRGKLTVAQNYIGITSRFDVRLEDHGIHIPRIVYQKISEIIRLNVSTTFSKID